MRKQAVLVALARVLAPLGAQGADRVVWWEKGYYSEEDEAVREIIAAFEHGPGAHVELTLVDQGELRGKIAVALEAGRPPDFLFGLRIPRRPLDLFQTCSSLMCSTGRCS